MKFLLLLCDLCSSWGQFTWGGGSSKTRVASVFRMTGGASVLTEVMKSGEKAEHTELLLFVVETLLSSYGSERETLGRLVPPGSVRCRLLGWKTDWRPVLYTDRRAAGPDRALMIHGHSELNFGKHVINKHTCMVRVRDSVWRAKWWKQIKLGSLTAN